MSGILYGIGVGPGAGDLLTLRAVNILQKVDVILTASSPKNEYSLAFEAVKAHLKSDVFIERADFPMTRDKAVLRDAWQKVAEKAEKHLSNNKDCAFLTIGDPLLYSTFGYLMRTLRSINPLSNIEIIPGITSFQAAAAATQTILCEGNENLLILPGTCSEEELAQGMEMADTAVILKAYRNFPAIRNALQKTSRLSSSIMASCVEQNNQSIITDISAQNQIPPYMSLILSKPDR